MEINCKFNGGSKRGSFPALRQTRSENESDGAFYLLGLAELKI